MSAADTTTLQIRTVPVWQGRINLRVQVKGTGTPILYLHPAGGMSWDGFLDDLADDHSVFAPEFPGTSPGDITAIGHLDDMFDVVLAYEEAVGVCGHRSVVRRHARRRTRVDVPEPVLEGRSARRGRSVVG